MSREFTANDSTGNFKKAHQAIGRPQVVDDMHEEYLKNPPNNIPSKAEAATGRADPANKAPRLQEVIDEMLPSGAMGESINGRKKQDEVLREMVEESEATT